MKPLIPIFLLCSLAGFSQVTFHVQPREIALNEVIRFVIVIDGDNNGRYPTF